MRQRTLWTLIAGFALSGSFAVSAQTAPSTGRTLEATAVIKPAVPKSGENTLEVTITEAGKPVTGLKLTSNVMMTNMDMGTAHPAVKESSPGHYTLKPVFTMSGPWRVTLVSAEPAFKLDFDMTAGGKEAWKPAKQTVKTAGQPVKPPPAKQEAPKVEPPKKEEPKEPPKEAPEKAQEGHGHTASSLPKLEPSATYVWTSEADWDTRTGFGKQEAMVAMMILMMVAGSGFEGMNMAPVAMLFDEANFTESGSAPIGAETRSLRVEAKLDKPVVGDNPVTVTVLTKGGEPVKKADIRASLGMTNMDMGTTHPRVKELGNGKYAVLVNVSMAGPWRLTLVVTAPGGQAEVHSFDFDAKTSTRQ